MSFTKFTSLESFGHVWRNKTMMINGPVVTYRPKIKLHGTNAAIRCENGEVFAQKRTSDVVVGDDNAGFALWLEEHKAAWAMTDGDGKPVIYHGEWAGPGVQSGDAVALLKQKYFFIFAVQVGEFMITDPEVIPSFLPEDGPALDRVVVLPWMDIRMTIDFSNPAAADKQAEEMNVLAEAIGTNDPFISYMFGIDGPGEGVVMVPTSLGDATMPIADYNSFVFKVKAARHGAKKAKAATRHVEIPEGAAEFIDMFVTEARLKQGLSEACGGIPDKTKTGDFLKWFGNDVRKESVVELEEAGIEWKQVAKLVNNTAVGWYVALCNSPSEVAA